MTSAQEHFAKAELFTDEELYVLVHLPGAAITAAAGVLAEIGTPFSALIVDKDEVSLVVLQDAWQEFKGRLRDYREAGDYRLITFDLPLDLDLVGFLAHVATVLAGANVSLMAFSAFERDHILVRASQFDTAWHALHAAQGHAPGDRA